MAGITANALLEVGGGVVFEGGGPMETLHRGNNHGPPSLSRAVEAVVGGDS